MVLGNPVRAYLEALAILVVGAAAVSLLRLGVGRIFSRRRKRAAAQEEEPAGGGEAPAAVTGVQRWFRNAAVPLLYLGVLYLALTSLSLGSRTEALLRGAVAVVVTVVIVRSVIMGLERLLRRYTERMAGEEGERRLKPLRSVMALVIWIVGFVFLLDNLGFDISAVVAGLGVSGIAIAIAAQGILGDLFNYFVILFDKPFEVGDFIIFDDKLGMVEKIGIKTTRIRALGGEELVIANSGLTGSRVHNYKRMENRRVVFSFGVTYDTKPEQLRRIPEIVRGIIEGMENTRFDRSHFKSYGDFSLIFENVYYVFTADYALYMDIQQEINLQLYEALEELGVEFAYPTSTVYIRHESGNARDTGP